MRHAENDPRAGSEFGDQMAANGRLNDFDHVEGNQNDNFEQDGYAEAGLDLKPEGEGLRTGENHLKDTRREFTDAPSGVRQDEDSFRTPEGTSLGSPAHLASGDGRHRDGGSDTQGSSAQDRQDQAVQHGGPRGGDDLEDFQGPGDAQRQPGPPPRGESDLGPGDSTHQPGAPVTHADMDDERVGGTPATLGEEERENTRNFIEGEELRGGKYI